MNAELAETLMNAFAERTGIRGERPPRRYLWTDAFAVCNFLALRRKLGEERYLQLAVTLVDQVHHILGRHRDDDTRRGWISGLGEDQGEQSPTCGGLRIGKSHPEPAADQRQPGESQWDADGQYFHYLTKWMLALERVAAETGDPRYLRWAVELGVTAHQAFTYQTPGSAKRMVWKMSIDLSRPLVGSMGHHDPLDGLITYLQLQQAASPQSALGRQLEPAIADMSQMCQAAQWATDDALGIGGLLMDAARLGHLVFAQRVASAHGVDLVAFLHHLLHETEVSLQHFVRTFPPNRSSAYRLAFRELGLSIGLRTLERLLASVQPDPFTAAHAAQIMAHLPLAERIETYWSASDHRRDHNWLEHEDINSVMLATSLEPSGLILSGK